jgi:hypothetical protein
MTQTISRIYANKTDANAAVADLEKHGFGQEEIFFVGPPSITIGASAADSQAVVDEIVDKIARGYIPKRHAAEYAKIVAQGGALVTVHASFGSGFKATVLLDRHHPVESGVPAPAYPRATYDEAAPLSSALHLPVLSSHPTPFGAVTGLPSVLSEGREKTFAQGPAPLSRLLELPVMTAEGRPTSSVIGLPAVTAKGAPTSLGLPLLTAKGAPTSLGLPLLTAKGKPTSLGLPLLWR